MISSSLCFRMLIANLTKHTCTCTWKLILCTLGLTTTSTCTTYMYIAWEATDCLNLHEQDSRYTFFTKWSYRETVSSPQGAVPLRWHIQCTCIWKFFQAVWLFIEYKWELPVSSSCVLFFCSMSLVEEGNVVRLRGLPYQASMEDISNFLIGLNIIPWV